MAASRRLYNELAVTISRHVDAASDDEYALLDSLVRDIASDLKQDNMSFKMDKFLAACGLTD